MDERVLGTFVKPDGTLLTIPRKRSKLLVVLEHLSQRFAPGQTYPEAEVNDLLAQAHPDFAALRRYLVVMSGQVVQAADGRLATERSVGPVVVVLV